MGCVEDHIELELAAGNVSPSVDALTHSLHNVLDLNNRRGRIRYSNRDIEPVTDLARTISFSQTLAEAAAAIREANRNEIAQPQEQNENDLELISQCERLVRRSLARNRHS